MTWRWLGLVTVLATVLTAVAVNLRAGDDDRDGLFDRAGDSSGYFWQPDSPFRATETRTVTLAQGERFVSEIEFEPPNAWQRNCPDQPYCSTIVVGDQAWNLQGDDWVQISVPAVFGTEALELLTWAGPELQAIGAGPAAAAEGTTRHQGHLPDYGESLALSGVTNKRGEPVTTYRDSTLTITATEGNDSGRLYELRVLISGPGIRDETIVRFEYDVDVDILPPLTRAQARPTVHWLSWPGIPALSDNLVQEVAMAENKLNITLEYCRP